MQKGAEASGPQRGCSKRTSGLAARRHVYDVTGHRVRRGTEGTEGTTSASTAAAREHRPSTEARAACHLQAGGKDPATAGGARSRKSSAACAWLPDALRGNGDGGDDEHGAARPKRQGATDERLWATSEPVRRRVRAVITVGIADALQGIGVDRHARASAVRDVLLVTLAVTFHQLCRRPSEVLPVKRKVLERAAPVIDAVCIGRAVARA